MVIGDVVKNVVVIVCMLILGVWLVLMFGGVYVVVMLLFMLEEYVWIVVYLVVCICVNVYWWLFEFVEGGKVVGIVLLFFDVVLELSGLCFEYVDGVCWKGFIVVLKFGSIDMLFDWSKNYDMVLY